MILTRRGLKDLRDLVDLDHGGRWLTYRPSLRLKIRSRWHQLHSRFSFGQIAENRKPHADFKPTFVST
jgi:hypothetical protein